MCILHYLHDLFITFSVVPGANILAKIFPVCIRYAVTISLSFQEPGSLLTRATYGCCRYTNRGYSRLRRCGRNSRLLVTLLCLFVGIMFLLSGPRHVPCSQLPPSPYTSDPVQANSITTAAGKSIPKYIHRIWNSGPIPDRFKGNWVNCQKVNPGYNTTLWDDAAIESLIQNHYPWFMPVYRSYPYHMERLDAARYFIVYHYGGIYIDMDVDCKVPFNEILKNASREKPFEVMTGGGLPLGIATSFFAAPMKHPFMLSLIHHLGTAQGWYLTPYLSVMASTGPVYIYREYLGYACKDQIYVLAPHLHKNIYMVHEHAGTWHQWDGPIYVWIDRHLRYVIWGVPLLVIVVITIVVVLQKRNQSYRHWSVGWRTLRRTLGWLNCDQLRPIIAMAILEVTASKNNEW